MLISSIRDGKKMWRHLVAPLAKVHTHYSVGVEWISLVGVDNHAEKARICLLLNKVEDSANKLKDVILKKFLHR